MFDDPVDTAQNAPAERNRADRALDWLKARERYVLLVGVAVQMVVLLGMTAHRATPLVSGETILLRVVPVDPRDLFRGDYVILSYDFSQFPPGGIEGLPARRSDASRGRTVYVSLVPEPDGKHYRADKFSVYRPSGGTYLRGQVVGWNRLAFGIESYYVQEGTGRKYEQAIRSRKLSAEVAVTSGGQATLRGLRIE